MVQKTAIILPIGAPCSPGRSLFASIAAMDRRLFTF
jgi:hypothetical protein